MLPYPASDPTANYPTKSLVKELARVRQRTVQRLALFVGACGVAVYLGCAVPMTCQVTPVNIEEIRSDIRDLDGEIAEKRTALSKLEAEIAELEASLKERQGRIPLTRAELDSLKKASGRTEGTATDTTATDTTATATQSGAQGG